MTTRCAAARAAAAARDAANPLAPLRQRFHLPEGIVYLDGNSLGPVSIGARTAVQRVMEVEWGEGLIRSWTSAGWIDAPRRVGERIAGLVGAAAGQVLACDTTSVNLFKLAAAALLARPGRHTILIEEGDFPTDRYIPAGIAELVPGVRVRAVAPGAAADALDSDVAVVLLSHVHFQSARVQDMDGITAAAHRAGALALWDLSHSVGAIPVALDAAGADLAVGCGYKFLSGGPGAPAFAYVAERHQEQLRQPITGWLGHADPFAFDTEYRPAPGVGRLLAGTPPILGLAALEGALEIWDEITLDEVRAVSLELTGLFLDLVDEHLVPLGVEPLTPPAAAERGSHVTLRHPRAYDVVDLLIEGGIIGDFRAPDLMRFGVTPLTTRFTDIVDCVAAMADALEGGDLPERPRRAVT